MIQEIESSDQVEIGHWYHQCCFRDLEQITDEDELKHVRESFDILEVYKTKMNALIDNYLSWTLPIDEMNSVESICDEIDAIHTAIKDEIRQSREG